MKNRDITKTEINKITNESKPREKAFFTFMRQSGLEPHIIKKLKIGNVERILEPNPPTPCKIETNRFGKPPAFIGEEGVKYVKQYLESRDNPKPESLLFTSNKDPTKEINTRSVSRAFKLTAQELKKSNKITFEVRRGKPSELHLSSLIQFYKENVKQYLKKLDSNHTPKDDEFCRKLYEEEAMPFLETETLTPEIYKLKKRLDKIEDTIFPKHRLITDWKAEHDRITEWIEKHPEEAKLEQERWKCWEEQREKDSKEYQRIMKENPEGLIAYLLDLEEKIEVLKIILREPTKQNNQQPTN